MIEKLGQEIVQLVDASYPRQLASQKVREMIIPHLIKVFFLSPPRQFSEIPISSECLNQTHKINSLRDTINEFRANLEGKTYNMPKENYESFDFLRFLGEKNWDKIKGALLLYLITAKASKKYQLIIMNSFKDQLTKKKQLMHFLIRKSMQHLPIQIIQKFYKNKKSIQLAQQLPKAIIKLHNRKMHSYLTHISYFYLLKTVYNGQILAQMEKIRHKRAAAQKNALQIFNNLVKRKLASIIRLVKAEAIGTNPWLKRWVDKAACSSPIQLQNSWWRMKKFVHANLLPEEKRRTSIDIDVDLGNHTAFMQGIRTKLMIEQLHKNVQILGTKIVQKDCLCSKSYVKEKFCQSLTVVLSLKICMQAMIAFHAIKHFLDIGSGNIAKPNYSKDEDLENDGQVQEAQEEEISSQDSEEATIENSDLINVSQRELSQIIEEDSQLSDNNSKQHNSQRIIDHSNKQISQ